jgi:hypothetical protein
VPGAACLLLLLLLPAVLVLPSITERAQALAAGQKY